MKQLFTSQIIDAAEVNQRWLEKSGHLLENVDQTHLVLASGKPELQKMNHSYQHRPKQICLLCGYVTLIYSKYSSIHSKFVCHSFFASLFHFHWTLIWINALKCFSPEANDASLHRKLFFFFTTDSKFWIEILKNRCRRVFFVFSRRGSLLRKAGCCGWTLDNISSCFLIRSVRFVFLTTELIQEILNEDYWNWVMLLLPALVVLMTSAKSK